MTTAFAAAAAITPGVSVTAAVLVSAGLAAPLIRADLRSARQARQLARSVDAENAYVDGYLDGVQRRKPRVSIGGAPPTPPV